MRRARYEGERLISILMTPGAFHTHDAVIVRSAHDGRIMQLELHSLKRHIPVRMAIQAPRMLKDSAGFAEQGHRTRTHVLNARKIGRCTQFIRRNGPQLESPRSVRRRISVASTSERHDGEQKNALHGRDYGRRPGLDNQAITENRPGYLPSGNARSNARRKLAAHRALSYRAPVQ